MTFSKPFVDHKEEPRHLEPWKVIQCESLLEISPWLEIRQEELRLPDGQIVRDFYSIEQPDFVVIFGTTSTLRVPCLWHYKHGPRRVCLGLPAGHIEDGESPLTAAKRELLEETGCKGKTWRELRVFTVDGNRGCGQAHMFFVRDIHKVCEPRPDDLEDMELVSCHA